MDLDWKTMRLLGLSRGLRSTECLSSLYFNFLQLSFSYPPPHSSLFISERMQVVVIHSVTHNQTHTFFLC